MAIIPSHLKPQCKEDFIDTWYGNGRIAVPMRSGGLIDLKILTFAETTLIDGRAADLLIEAQATNDAPVKRFAVAFTSYKPAPLQHLPLLWMNSAFEPSWVLPEDPGACTVFVARDVYLGLPEEEREHLAVSRGLPMNIEDATCILPGR